MRMDGSEAYLFLYHTVKGAITHARDGDVHGDGDVSEGSRRGNASSNTPSHGLPFGNVEPWWLLMAQSHTG
jgi:hypothetical protein